MDTSRLVSFAATVSRAEVEQRALRFAACLLNEGVKSGERVMLMADNGIDMIATLLALIHLDASIVLLDHRLTDADCQYNARLTQASWFLTDRDEILDADIGSLQLSQIAQAAEELDPVSTELSMVDWLHRRDALILWSSGSTGAAKAVLRRGQVMHDHLATINGPLGYRESDVVLPLVPFTHFYGATQVLLWWTLRCTLVITPAGRLDQALRLAPNVKPTVVAATPSTYHSILRSVDRLPSLRSGLEQVRVWRVGGAPLSEKLAYDFAAAFGAPLLDGYGSTEAGNIALAPLDNPVGCGRPLDGVDVSIVDPQGKPVPAGQIGEILVRAPALMEGYLAEDGTLYGADAERYVTNDHGYFDEYGNLFVLGRSSAIHRFGHTLYPGAIERRAQECGAPVKVFAFDDERRGSQLVFVVADPDEGEPRHWQDTINALLPSYEQPNHVVVVDEFPLTANGKPDLAGLRQLAGDRVRP